MTRTKVKPMAELELITVPKNTAASTCTGADCGKEIYWIERRSVAKKYAKVPVDQRPIVRVPVDCDVDDGQQPDSMQDGRGHNHFTNCPNHDDF